MKVTRNHKTGIYRKIYERVRCVPHGRVTTYGEIARMVGCSARQVGYAMAATPRDEGIPWQRVVNRFGRISLRNSGHPDLRQQLILEEEGVEPECISVMQGYQHGQNLFLPGDGMKLVCEHAKIKM